MKKEKGSCFVVFLKFFGVVIAIFLLLIAVGNLLGGSESESKEPSVSQDEVSETAQPEPVPSGNGINAEDWPTLANLDITNESMMQIYNDFEDAFKAENGYPEDVNEIDAYEEKVNQDIADKYGLTSEQALHVYFYVGMHYAKVANNGIEPTADYHASYGEVVSVETNKSTAVVKMNMGKRFDKQTTIEMCYSNVCELIRNCDLHLYETIKFWAAIETSNGEELKLISFTVPRKTITNIYNDKNFPYPHMDNYVEDLWIAKM